MTDPNPLLLLLLFLAVAAGWVLGRGGNSRDATEQEAPPAQYYLGLNFLLDGEQESALKAFSEALAVNADTFETHITFGNLLRKRGEVDNAIKIHQSLLSRENLPDIQKHQAHVELARDFIAAGLMDRAEQLLEDLQELSTEHKQESRTLLIDVFEAQRDWSKAKGLLREKIDSETLSGSERAKLEKTGAHYCCEEAEDALAGGDLDLADALVKEAFSWSDNTIWPSTIAATVESKRGHPRAALDRLLAAVELDPSFVIELWSDISDYADAVDARSELLVFLQRIAEGSRDPALRVLLIDELVASGDIELASKLVTQGVEQTPSTPLLSRYAAIHEKKFATDEWRMVAEAATAVSGKQSAYRCGVCGFHGPSFYWRCPGCKQWETLDRVKKR